MNRLDEMPDLSEADIQAWKDVLATKAGRRVLTWIIYDLAKLESATFTGSSHTFHLEGRRHVAVQLQHVIERLAPEDRVRMITEMLQEELAERRKRDLDEAQKGLSDVEE